MPCFLVSDAMVLIAVLFAALVWDGATARDALRVVLFTPVSFWSVVSQAAKLVLLLIPILVLGSLTLTLMRLQPPRPPWRRLAQQPGSVACVVASLASIAVGLLVVMTHLFAGRGFAVASKHIAGDLKPEGLTVVAPLIGMAILMTWIVLGAKRRWRPEPSWIDRLGRVLGAGWILMIVGGMLQLTLELARLAGVVV